MKTSGEMVGMASPKVPSVSVYMGVPFAKPPVGPLRFAPPETLNSTARVEAKTQKPGCHGTISFMSGSKINEDCLYMNVWAKPQVGRANKVYAQNEDSLGFDGSKYRP
jgi:carboxylesterase type B